MATKQKVESVRTYDKDGYRRRAACVCIRDPSQKEVLLVSTSHDPDLWIVPGGGVEPTEQTEEAAVREVLEEAGVKGTIAACLGLFESSECKHRTMVYLMVVHEVLNEWQEALSMGRKRRWFPMEEARNHLGQHRPSHRRYLDILHPPPNPLPHPNANNCNSTNEAYESIANGTVCNNNSSSSSSSDSSSTKITHRDDAAATDNALSGGGGEELAGKKSGKGAEMTA